MKKIIFMIALILSCFSLNTYAAQYENIGAHDEWGHDVLGNIVGQATVDYINNGGTSVEELRQVVNIVISGAGGWDGQPLDASDPRYNNLARIEGDYVIVGCGNADLAKVYIGGSGGTPSAPPADSSSGGGSEPPPAPVITTGPGRAGSCGSYVASWSPNWSSCDIQGTAWNQDGTISCRQTVASFTPASYGSCGDYSCENTYVDGVLVGESCTPCGPCSDAGYPSIPPQDKTITMMLSNPTTETNNAYANNSDVNKVQVRVSGATNQNRAIVGWGNAGKFSGFTDSSNLPSDLVAKTGKALGINHSQDVTTVNPNGILLEIPVTSKTPFEGKGEISFQAGSVLFVLKNVQYSFKKPFVGFIQTWDHLANTWEGVTSLGTENRYRLGLNKRSSLELSGLTQYTLNNFASAIEPNGDGLEIQAKSVSGATLTSKTGTEFFARINTSASATTLNQKPSLQINLPVVSYTLGGQTVKYYLSEADGAADGSPIKTEGSEFLGVRVIGGIQGAGKSEFTGQQANISNLYNSEQRTIIRKNAYDYVKNMKSGDTVGSVKYVLGDTTISGDVNYETLVVVDGNVTITDNLNNSKKKLGIIVLKDNYDVNTDIEGKGNVYIKPNVTQINAIIYSDGGLISTDTSGKVFATDSSSRTGNLNKQLILNGSVFTRNTIGGAILAGGDYILPGGVKTQDFDKAMNFDLNYIRRGNSGCEKKADKVTCVYNEPFVIKYDSRVQTSPPKLFSK